ncbi:MAG: glycosyltransferase family 4 protein [Chloroflexi bacterium]|nr:glycosyltransferase family 4 protein [Chloroflexota bacterium]
MPATLALHYNLYSMVFSPQHPPHIAVNGWMAGRLDSGSGQYLSHLLEWLPAVAPGSRITLLQPLTGKPAQPLRWPQVEVAPIALPQMPPNLAKVWWEQVAAPRAARALGADVYFVPYWAAPWWRTLPTVVTIHDLIPLLLPSYRGGLAQRLYTALVTRTAQRADAVVTVSEAAARDIVAHLNIDPARIHVVHHGPNQEGMPPPSEADLARARTRYALPDRYFLYLGGFDVRKNLSRVLAAYARYRARGGDPTVQLVLAGALPATDSAFFPDPHRLAREAGCAEALHCCGWVAEEDKPALYRLAVALVFPSLYEGFGMMLLEAMQAGTPVITSDR